MTVTDDDLMARTAAGDRDAFAALYDRLAPRAFGLILQLVRIHTDAEDVLQETFLQVWHQAARFDRTKCPPDGWVLMIARCRAVDKLRRRREAVASPADAPAPTEDPGLDLERAETAEKVAAALAHLPDDQQAVIRLAFYAGLTHEEIARRLGLPLGTVKTRIRLGLIRLRDRLGSDKLVYRTKAPP